MRKGEKIIVVAMLASVGLLAWMKEKKSSIDDDNLDVPFYSTATKEVTDRAAKTMHDIGCRKCHSLWGVRDLSQAVPAPALDGMGMFRDEEWLYTYFSAENPQEILPSRLKPEYRMPSLASLSEEERRNLANYMANLKLHDWFFQEAKEARYEKLTGKDYQPDD